MKYFKQYSTFHQFALLPVVFILATSLFSCKKDINAEAEQPLGVTSKISSNTNAKNDAAAIPFDMTVFVPCANSGTGENVVLTGTTNFVYQMAWNKNAFYLTYHENRQGVKGVGAITGDEYVASGILQGNVTGSWVNEQFKTTTNEQLRITGKGISFVIKYKQHLNINPGGTLTMSKEEEVADCNP